MLFNSIPFLIFLPIVFVLYWRAGRRAQNLLLVCASYVFYGWWDWRFLGLIVLSSATDYVAGKGIATGRHRRTWLGVSLTVNLGALGVFKYLDFGVESLAALLRTLGFEPHLPTLGIAVPVGISFYTFQTLSYTIDIYRRRVEPAHDPIAFFAFVAFFPQLVAGPIERARTLLPQFLRERRFDAARAADGCREMLYGLFLKVVVADNLAAVVDPAYADPERAGGWALTWATYAFAFQIYADFAGYSHVAIGCARLFGFSLRRNFAYPYFARSPAEFWHRWHMSLSTWFRDYVYIPLGGSLAGDARRRWNVLVTFVTSGAWHGAGFTFLAWGALHGAVVALQWWDPKTELENPLRRRGRAALADALAVLATFHVACLGWVLFRAPDLAAAGRILGEIGEAAAGLAPSAPPALLAWALVVVALEFVQRRRPHALDVPDRPRTRRALCVAAALAIVVAGRVDTVPFIYFQF